MFVYGVKAAVALAAVVASAAALPTQQPKKAEPPPVDQQVIKSKPTKGAAAASVKFRKDLGLPHPSLGTLGSRIDAARRAGDPVTLANAASELAVAEKVSGKTAGLTSKQLLAESAELAAVRRQETELRSVLQVANNLQVEEATLNNLKKQLAFAQQQTALEKDALKKNQEPTSTPRKVIVNNYSTQYIDIQINGYLRGQVNPGSTQVFTIDQRWNPIVLKGWGDADENTFGPVVLQGAFDKYTWNINNDDSVPNLPGGP